MNGDTENNRVTAQRGTESIACYPIDDTGARGTETVACHAEQSKQKATLPEKVIEIVADSLAGLKTALPKRS